MCVLRIFLHALSRLLLRLLFGASWGQAIDEKQCIVVANHDTHLDTFALFGLFPLRRIGRVHAVAAEDYFKRGFLGVAAKLLFNAVLIRRVAGEGMTALDPVRRALDRGDSIIVFPEGTRGEPGVLLRFRSGVGVLALEYPDLPIVPVALKGIERTLPKGGSLPVPFSFQVERLASATGRELEQACGADRKAIAAELEHRVRSALAEA